MERKKEREREREIERGGRKGDDAAALLETRPKKQADEFT